jgi:hypothetical protein
MSRYWVSWKEPGEDSRPKKIPHPPEVVAWWESGIGEGFTTVCAVMDLAEEATEESITTLLEGYWDPSEFRFIEPKDDDWRPANRFPWPDDQNP